MRISLIILLTLGLTHGAVAAPDYSAEVKSEFRKYFGEAIPEVIQAGKIDLITEKLYETPAQMPVKMRFHVDGVEKVLLLNVRSNGYSREGLYYESCAREPAFLAAYTMNKKNSPKELEARIRTSCIDHQVILMLWVKTTSGYYLDTAAFQTTSESPGE